MIILDVFTAITKEAWIFAGIMFVIGYLLKKFVTASLSSRQAVDEVKQNV